MFANKPIFRIIPALFVVVSTLAVTPLHVAAAADVRYAKSGGTGDCSSWANACALQTALTGATSGDEIWVKTGTYKPTTDPTDRTATFQLKDGVAVYGGFVGAETTRDQRNPENNGTILSGDVDNNDSQTPIITDLATVTGNTTNSYHVVTGATGATLDGFTITAGNANGYDCPNVPACGGGMYNYSSSPALSNITFSGNLASVGGGMANTYGSSPILTNVTFSSNSAGYGGGGMFDWGSSPTLTNVTFSDNSAGDDGGGMYSDYGSLPTLTNVTFSHNMANNYGGGMSNFDSSPTLTNVTFSGNSANYGGGMSNYYSSNPHIRNTIFWENTASSGEQINSGINSDAVVSESVVQNGCSTGSTCTSILTTDPKLGTLGDYGGFTQTIPLLAGSSAIDTGNDDKAVCPATDQRGVSRPQGAHCDIGAFEVRVYSIYLPMIQR